MQNLRAYAKINLTLEIESKKSNGYHELASVMQTVTLFDELQISRRNDKQILLKTNEKIAGENSIVKAANAFFSALGESFGLDIVLTKNIPIEAGLGGGSADAAATLRAMNEMLPESNRFSAEKMIEIATTVGADVPFCLAGGCCLCRGIGEKMNRIPGGLSYGIVLITAGQGVSTKEAFADMDAANGNYAVPVHPAQSEKMAKSLQTEDLNRVCRELYNCFEPIISVKRPAILKVERDLKNNGALAVSMSGSGPSVFGIFKNFEAAKKAEMSLRNEYSQIYAVSPLYQI